MRRAVTILLATAVFTLSVHPLMATENPRTVSTQQTAAPVSTAVNINTASVIELEKLPGIGQKSAAAIVAYRAEKGKFKNMRELLKVKGVGKKTLEKIKNLIIFE